MNPPKKQHNPPNTKNQQSRKTQSQNHSNNNIADEMVKKIDDFLKEEGLRKYQIRDLVKDTEELGRYLAVEKQLKTNQIRKFLDAINRFKIGYAKRDELSEQDKDELHVLRYQLTYAAARQAKKNDLGPVDPLKRVLESAIKKVEKLDDFNRLVQLIEAIIAYHKAAGGTNQ